MKTSTLNTALAFLAALLFVACSSKPRLSDGEQALRFKIERESEGRLKMLHFKKTGDEMTIRFPGENLDNFCWAFEGEVQAIEDCLWLFDRATGSLPVDFRTARLGEQADGATLRQGQRYTVVGAFYLSKAAKRWEASGLTMRKVPREIR
jgi:type II secretory pathway component PulJ